MFRRFAEFRSAPLPWRLTFGASTAALGLLAFLGVGDLVDEALVLAVFFPAVQVAALLGGLAAAACSGLLSAAIVHFWITPFSHLSAGFLLFFVSVALMGLAARGARSARGASRDRRREEAAVDFAVSGGMFESAVANIAHDVNQPLAAALAYIHTARRVLAAETAETRATSVAETLEKAAAQLTRAGRLVAGLREFLAHGPSRRAPVSLHALIRETVAAGARDAIVALRLDARSDVVLADRTQIEQLIAGMLPFAKGVRISTFSDAAVVTVELAFEEHSAVQSAEPESWKADQSIWRAIVEAHQGAFRIEPSPVGCSAIAFSLPLVSPSTTIGG